MRCNSDTVKVGLSTVRKRKWLSLLLAVMMLVSAVPLSSVAADAADGTVEVSTWEELKRAL